MSDSTKDNNESNGKNAASSSSPAPFDPATLLSLYSMQYSGLGAFGGFPGFASAVAASTAAASTAISSSTTTSLAGSTLGVAASQAASLGMNQASAAWWTMASQLAAQDYLSRIQAASRDPSAYAALAAQGVLPNYEMLSQGSKSRSKAGNGGGSGAQSPTPSGSAGKQKSSGRSSPSGSASPSMLDSLRLPSDTEIIKYTSSSAGPKVPGTTNRGRKKTISLDPSTSPPTSLPSGLTIERKKPGRKSTSNNAVHAEDRVEITKIPVAPGSNGSSGLPKDFSFPRSHVDEPASVGDSPLNLSMKSSGSGAPSASDLLKGLSASKIPPEYYASQALSGVFLAEQIRQQQLAAALESRLTQDRSAASANLMQTLLINKLTEAGTGVTASETSKLLAIAAAAAANGSDKSSSSSSSARVVSKNGRGSKKSQDKFGTVAALLAASKERNRLTAEELEAAEKSMNSNPELTIEPIFRSLKPDTRFDISDNGRRFATDVVDGKVQIKTVSDSPEIRNLNDQGHPGDFSDSEMDGNNDASKSNPGRYATVETNELRLPLKMGWRRETMVREYCKSGVRGDVSYYAPCGKKFKQYPDITRYLERKGCKDLQREHFSFSTRIFIGDFFKPTGQMMENGEEKYIQLNEDDMIRDVEKIRKENGWKPVRRTTPSESGSRSKKKSANVEASKPNSNAAPMSNMGNIAAVLANPNLTPEQRMLKLQEELQLSGNAMNHQEQVKLQKEALKFLKEAEKYEKMEQARREKEAKQQLLLAEKKKKQEELLRQKAEENLKKEQRRQQAELERERRRQHMILIRQLEGKKRNDEREKRKEEFRIEREKERERKVEQKRIENEILTELRKPIEDMCLEDLKPLPELKRIEGLKLSGEAYANVLMVYEFLHNFGGRLGFDTESLPTLSDLQAALLNDPEAEEELLSVLIHLVVCAIDDPGIPTPHKHLTILGQNLRVADITNTNVSEILKLYLTARGQVEVKHLHGLVPPETHSAKDRNKEIPYDKAKMAEFNRLLKQTRAYEMAQWVKERPFLCLNPTAKSEIMAFVCNELLCNRSIIHQVDMNVEKANKARKIKLLLETKVKKLRFLYNRKFKTQVIVAKLEEADQSTNMSNTGTLMESECASEAASTIGEDKEDDTMSMVSDNDTTVTPAKKGPQKGKRGKKVKPAKKGKKKSLPPPPPPKEEEEEEEEEDDHLSEADLADLEEDGEDDDKLTQEELQKKIDRTVKLYIKKKEEAIFTNNSMRVTDLGQDRYRRRYWHMAHAGGVYVEAMESCEPWKLPHKGMAHEKKRCDDTRDDSDEPVPKKPKLECLFDIKPPILPLNMDQVQPKQEIWESKLENGETRTTLNIPKIQESDNEKAKRWETEEALKKLGSEILVTPKMDAKNGVDEPRTPIVTPNAEKVNLFNHSSSQNMTLSPMILNGSVTITPKSEPNFLTSTPLMNPHSVVSHHSVSFDHPWFSILPLNNPADNSAKFLGLKQEGLSTLDRTKALLQAQCPVNPQIALLELKLDRLRKDNFGMERQPIPDDVSRGWWHITDPEQICELEKKFHHRGAREQQLQQNMRRTMDFCKDPDFNKKPLAEDVVMDLEDVEINEDIEMLPGDIPAPDKPGSWSKEVALRVDKYILEQVEALEDKVAAASMQVPGWKLPNRPDIETRSFRPSCEPVSGPNDKRADPIEEARQRLLELEANIERRYLKAPLGVSNSEVSLETITSSASKPPPTTTAPSATAPVSRRTTNTSLNISKELSENKNSDDKENEHANEDDNGDEGEEMGEDEEDEDDSPQQSPTKKCNLPRGLVVWRKGVEIAKTAAQLAMGFYVLETSIAWHKSIMKAYCQLCHSGDDEESLLLCDGCDKGYHMYCFKPAITQIPSGDWYCYECINKATASKHCLVCGKLEGKNLVPCTSCPRAYHTECLSPALSKVPRGKWQCPGCNQKTPKKKVPKKLKIIVGNPDDSNDSNSVISTTIPYNAEKEESLDEKPPPEKKAKKEPKAKKNKEKDLTPCKTLIEELEASDDSWPFLFPVNTKQFPTYKKIIKIPMDIDTIKKRLENGGYKTREEFRSDVRQIFANCEVFNEDDSPVGKAGHALRTLFDTRWVELMGQETSSK
ncbi:bromodomain adjacent to zinc finger domain protein 2B-like [Tigriopus californicus]|uniref:bromodomain adjacent to zinc finger domain protein 2B-like n=1 Tax=Tigriopus californicus TaxID=6832 RepID=UPI0027D9DB99|nr:bromodomain adjacent to zinc finger domain protein 2B-like [Tigriopus californicus]